MPKHKFQVGEAVAITQGYSWLFQSETVYTVVEAMPTTGDRLLYRIQRPGERYEYVVGEHALYRPDATACG